MLILENALQCGDYRRLRESVGWTNGPEAQARRALEGSALTVAAVEGGETVGMARLVGDGLYYLVADVVVRPDFQGRGIGGGLVRALLAYAAAQTPPGGRASVLLAAQPGKEAFYERLGFRRLPHEHCGPGMRIVLHGG